MGLQSRFLKTAWKWPFLSRISTKSQNFTTCKFVGHSPTLAVPAKIMLDHPEKCQEPKRVSFRNPYLAPIWPLWTPWKWSLGGRNPWKLPTPNFYAKWTITSRRINIFGRGGREALSPFYSKPLLRASFREIRKTPEYPSRVKILKKPETRLGVYLINGIVDVQKLVPFTQLLVAKKRAGKFKFGLFRGIRFCALFYLWLSHGFSIQEGH